MSLSPTFHDLDDRINVHVHVYTFNGISQLYFPLAQNNSVKFGFFTYKTVYVYILVRKQ